MKTVMTLILAAGLLAVSAPAQVINFDDAKSGEAPAGWTATKTGQGEPKWTVVADNTTSFRQPYRFFFEYVNDPNNGLKTLTLPFDGGLEMVVKV